jgi:DNA polymerase-3 subunit alpha
MAACGPSSWRAAPKTSHIPASKAEKIFDNIEKFAGYGFNKSHSAAYAVVGWQTAFLKAHYPVEFMAANLTVDIGNNERLTELIAECQEMDIEVLPPSVNESGVRFTALPPGNAEHPRAIRFGMAGVKNVGVGAVESIVAERTGPAGPSRACSISAPAWTATLVNRKTWKA